jgi:adenylate cyclase
LRITARLLDAETGRHLWADKFDGALDDVFDLQDDMADRVAGIVEPGLRRAEIERSRRKRTAHMDAYDCYLPALPLAAAQMPEEAGRAIPLLDRALKFDPDAATAHALIARCHEPCFARGGFAEAQKSAALRHASTVLGSDTDDGTALAVAGFVMTLLTADHQAAPGAIDRGLALNPSSATVLYLGAQAHALAGLSGKAMAFADRALWLNAFDPLAFQAHMALGEAAVLDDRHGDAASCFARAAQAKPNFSSAYIFQGIALALAAHAAQGARRARCGLALEPGFRTRLFYEHGLVQPLREKLARGSRLLGLAA